MRTNNATGSYAYIDNQNLYLSTTRAANSWNVDMKRLFVYLREKYGVVKAYLFVGARMKGNEAFYKEMMAIGYEVVFREHGKGLLGAKKGNVDTDVVFQMMHDAFADVRMNEVVLVSGDGDYYRTVEYLKNTGMLKKVLLPSRQGASSLYKRLSDEFVLHLDQDGIKGKISKRGE